MVIFLTLVLPIIYLLVVGGLLYLFFKILDGIRKSNLERNEILRGIYEELKKQHSEKI